MIFQSTIDFCVDHPAICEFWLLGVWLHKFQKQCIEFERTDPTQVSWLAEFIRIPGQWRDPVDRKRVLFFCSDPNHWGRQENHGTSVFVNLWKVFASLRMVRLRFLERLFEMWVGEEHWIFKQLCRPKSCWIDFSQSIDISQFGIWKFTWGFWRSVACFALWLVFKMCCASWELHHVIMRNQDQSSYQILFERPMMANVITPPVRFLSWVCHVFITRLSKSWFCGTDPGDWVMNAGSVLDPQFWPKNDIELCWKKWLTT